MANPKVEVDIVADGSKARRELDKTSRAFDTFGKGLKGASLAGAGIVTAIAGIGAAGLTAATDLERSNTTLDRLFGASSTNLKTWAEDAAEQVGISSQAYSSLAVDLGVAVTDMGLAGDAAATKVDDMLGLAGDMALALGTDVPTAVGAMSAALRGEFDALGEFGVKIDDASVKAGLAAAGLDTLTGAEYDAAYQAELLAQVVGGVGEKYGGYREETETTAESQQQLTAKWEDAQRKLAELLMPALETLVGWLEQVVNWVEDNWQAIEDWVPWIGAATGAILLLNIAINANKIVLLTTAIIAFSGAMTAYIVEKAPEWNQAIEDFWAEMQTADFWLGQLDEAAGVVGLSFDSFRTTIDNVKQAVADLWNYLSSLDWSSFAIELPNVGIPPGLPGGGLRLAPAGLAAPAAGSDVMPASLRAGVRVGVSPPSAPSVVINVTGALDPDAVARQIDHLLTARGRRAGIVTSTPRVAGRMVAL